MAFEPVFDASNATPFKFENMGDKIEGYYMGSFDYTGTTAPPKSIFSRPRTVLRSFSVSDT